MCGILAYPCFIRPTKLIGGLWVPGSRSNRTHFVLKFWLSFWTSPKNSNSWLLFSLTLKSIRVESQAFLRTFHENIERQRNKALPLGEKITLQSNNKHTETQRKNWGMCYFRDKEF